MFPSIRLLLLSCALAHNLVFAFDWLAPFKAPRSTARKSLVHPSPLVAPAQTRVPKVYGLPGDVAKVRASTVRGRSSLLRSSATIEKTKRGSRRPVKRIVVVIPPKEGSTPKAALAPPSKVTAKQAAALPDAKLYEHEYWFDPRIHNWGNVGWGGLVHAIFAPLATYAIDKLSYGGVDVRRKVHEMIPADASVLDLCCGTGFSSARGATAIDTSREMITVAKLRRPDCKFETGNAETYGETNSYDVVTMMFATHESESAPASAPRACVHSHRRPKRSARSLSLLQSPAPPEALAETGD